MATLLKMRFCRTASDRVSLAFAAEVYDLHAFRSWNVPKEACFPVRPLDVTICCRPVHLLSALKLWLFPLLQAVHLAQSSFQVEAFGSTFILDLVLNK